MLRSFYTPKKSAGFTLIEVAVVIAIVSVMGVAALQTAKVKRITDVRDRTIQNVTIVNDALLRYLGRNGHYPCAASPTAAVDGDKFGKGECTGAGVVTDSNPNPGAGGSKNVVIGTVPFADLGIASTVALDGWGNRLKYAVSLDLTGAIPYNIGNGAITVLNGPTASSPMGPVPHRTPFVLLSMGPRGAGGHSAGGVAIPLLCNTYTTENCNNNAVFRQMPYASNPSEFDNVFGDLGVRLSRDAHVYCGNKGRIYGPSHPGRSSSGESCPDGLTVGNFSDNPADGSPPTPPQVNDHYVGIGTDAPDYEFFPESTLHVNGDVRIGLVRTGPHTPPPANNYGSPLLFSGGKYVWTGVGAGDTDNTDPLWIARYNVASDESELRINIGDNPGGGADTLAMGVCGYTGGTTLFDCAWTPRLTVKSTGMVGIGTSTPTEVLDVVGNANVSGNINVSGNAKVSGEVDIGNSGTACTNANRGALRYFEDMTPPSRSWIEYCSVNNVWKRMPSLGPAVESPEMDEYNCPPGHVVVGIDCTGSCGSSLMTINCAPLQ